MTRFYGWVPTVTGRRSFSMFGRGCARARRSAYLNVADEGRTRRAIALYHHGRNTSDKFVKIHPNFESLGSWFSRPIVKMLNIAKTIKKQTKNRQEFDFYLIAASEPVFNASKVELIGELVGKIYICQTASNKSLKEGVWGKISNRVNLPDDVQLLLEEHKLFQTELDEACIAKFGFSLSRAGKAEITILENKENPPQDSANVSYSREVKEHDIAFGAYNFLKEITHHHYHHNRDSDSITGIYRDGYLAPLDWAAMTLRVIIRHCSEARRWDNMKKVENAIGALAYARTLKSLAEKKQTDKSLVQYDLDGLEKSLMSRLARLRDRSNSFFWVGSGVLAIFIAMISVVLTLGSPDRVGDIAYYRFNMAIANNSWLFFLIHFVAFLSILIISQRLDSGNRQLVRTFTRIVLGVANARKYWAITLMSFVLLSILAAAFVAVFNPSEFFP